MTNIWLSCVGYYSSAGKKIESKDEGRVGQCIPGGRLVFLCTTYVPCDIPTRMRRKTSHRKSLGTRPPLQRMIYIHSALKAQIYPTRFSLARELEVSYKSIGRDIEFMRDRLELPIEFDPGVGGYYYTGEVASFPALTISEGELLALVVAEKAMQQYRGTSFEKPLVNALKKLSESLPDTISFHLNDWDQSISFRTSAESILDLKLFDALAQATTRREQLRLFYRKPGQQTAEYRTVDPYHLTNVNGEWFLFGFDHLRKAIRTFAPTRILRIEKTGESFARDPNFSIERELQNSFGIHSGKGSIKVLLRFNETVADYIREKKWHPSQKLRNLPNGGVELEMTLSSLVEISRWVLNWGGNAQVLAPAELRDSVRRAADKILALHG